MKDYERTMQKRWRKGSSPGRIELDQKVKAAKGVL